MLPNKSSNNLNLQILGKALVSSTYNKQCFYLPTSHYQPKPQLQLQLPPSMANNSTLNPSISQFHLQWQPHHHHHKNPISLSFSAKPRRRRRHRNPIRKNRDSSYRQNSSSFDSNKLQFVLDVDQLKTRTPIGYLESKLTQFVNLGIDAYDDLRHLIVIEPGSNRVVVSCSDSTVKFVGAVAIWGFVGVVLVRVLVKLGLGFGGGRGGGGGGDGEVVKRRDRSLGGREVVVERKGVVGGERVVEVGREVQGMRRGSASQKEVKKLPSWWPVVAARRPVVEEEDGGAYRREANKLVQAITDDKLRGKDVSEEDILELHRICRMSGIQLSFGTENARDSFYRLAVNNVINTCCRVGSPSVQIDGEDARSFIAGLAYDVGLSNPRAATIVSAAVAAQTRLWFLQAWAFEMQAKHSEAIEELRKICLIHQIFPPEPSSAEMEMVARGLQKNLNLEQREFLLTNLISVCGEESPRSAAEALGLV